MRDLAHFWRSVLLNGFGTFASTWDDVDKAELLSTLLFSKQQ